MPAMSDESAERILLALIYLQLLLLAALLITAGVIIWEAAF